MVTRLSKMVDYQKVDPNHESCFGASKETMQTHFRTFKQEFSQAYSKWTASGNNDPDSFENFVNGNTMLTYGFLVIEKDITNMGPLFTAELAGEISTDTSSETKVSPVPSTPRPRSVKGIRVSISFRTLTTHFVQCN